MLKAITCHRLSFPGYNRNDDVSVISEFSYMGRDHGPFAKYVKLWVVYALGMQGASSLRL